MGGWKNELNRRRRFGKRPPRDEEKEAVVRDQMRGAGSKVRRVFRSKGRCNVKRASISLNPMLDSS